jgi:chromosomal replication initiation ATPase DnaA
MVSRNIVLNRYKRARKILKNISIEYDIDMPSLLSRSQMAHFVVARRAFILRCKENSIGSVVIGKVLGRNCSTIVYHQNSQIKKRKQAYSKRWRASRDSAILTSAF